MPKIIPIVEGEGEVEAVPTLLWKILREMGRYDVQIALPKNANGCKNLTKPGGLEQLVEWTWQDPDCGAILILMDADKDCVLELAQSFAVRINAMGVRNSVVIVIAKCEYEAWFLASLETIAGKNRPGRAGLPTGLTYPDDVEARVGVKGWLDRHFPKGRIYKPQLDQAAMTAMIDPVLARSRSRSFRRLCHAVEQALWTIDNAQTIVTPRDTTP